MREKIEIPSKQELTNIYMQKNATAEKLALKYYVSKSTFNSWLRLYGISKHKEIKKCDIEKYLADELSYKVIIEKLDCTLQTLYLYMKKHGLKKKFEKIHIDNKELYHLRVECLWTIKELAELYKVSAFIIQCEIKDFPKVKVEKAKNRWRRVGKKVSYANI